MSLEIDKTAPSTTPQFENELTVSWFGMWAYLGPIRTCIRTSKKAVFFSLPDSSFELVVDKLGVSLCLRMQPKWKDKQNKIKKHWMVERVGFLRTCADLGIANPKANTYLRVFQMNQKRLFLFFLLRPHLRQFLLLTWLINLLWK